VPALPFIGVARGGAKGVMLPKIFGKHRHLGFERRFSKQNSVIRLKSNILAPPKFWAHYAVNVLVLPTFK